MSEEKVIIHNVNTNQKVELKKTNSVKSLKKLISQKFDISLAVLIFNFFFKFYRI